MVYVPGTFYGYLNVSPMGYPILRGILEGGALVVFDGLVLRVISP